MKAIDRLLERVPDARRSGKSYKARCPAHDDKNPSLSITEGDGRAHVKCHAGCSDEAVLHAWGLGIRDLYDDDAPRAKAARPVAAVKLPARTYATPEDAEQALGRHCGYRAGRWEYRDASGGVVAYVLRFDQADGGKTFRPVARCESGWRVEDPPSWPLYRLQDLTDAETVFVVEGEKCVDAARGIGLTATTSAHGSGSPHCTDWSPLAGKRVVILPDNDEAGEKYAAKVCSIAESLSPPAMVCVVRLSERPDAGGDTADIVDAAADDDDRLLEVRRRVDQLAEDAFASAAATATTDAMAVPAAVREWVPFPADLLPPCVREYVVQTADGMAADPAMVALPMLAGLAAAIGNTRTITLKHDWDEPSILWTAVVAESGSLKTPTQKAALRFTADREAGIEEQNAAALEAYDAERMIHETQLAAWKQEARRGGDRDMVAPPTAPTKPQQIACIVSDSTVEAIAGILADNPRGVLLERDELAGWLAGFDRYKAGGAGRVSSEVGHWLSMHSAATLRVDRKSTGRVFVPRASLSIAGGIQPATLTQAIGQEHLANGLLARFLLAAPPRRRKRFNTATADFATVEAVRRLFHTLHGLPMPDGDPKRLPLSADGEAAFAEFYERHAIRLEEATGPMAAMLAKAEATAARLALVIHVCRQAGDEPMLPHAVDAESIRRGVGLAEWFAAEWERVYEATVGCAAKPDPEAELLGWIEIQGGEVPVRTIHDRMKRFNKNAALLEQTVKSLAARGRLETFSVQSPRGGRPAEWVRLPRLGKSGNGLVPQPMKLAAK